MRAGTQMATARCGAAVREAGGGGARWYGVADYAHNAMPSGVLVLAEGGRVRVIARPVDHALRVLRISMPIRRCPLLDRGLGAQESLLPSCPAWLRRQSTNRQRGVSQAISAAAHRSTLPRLRRCASVLLRPTSAAGAKAHNCLYTI
jgi:hypothetical protein